MWIFAKEQFEEKEEVDFIFDCSDSYGNLSLMLRVGHYWVLEESMVVVLEFWSPLAKVRSISITCLWITSSMHLPTRRLGNTLIINKMVSLKVKMNTLYHEGKLQNSKLGQLVGAKLKISVTSCSGIQIKCWLSINIKNTMKYLE